MLKACHPVGITAATVPFTTRIAVNAS